MSWLFSLALVEEYSEAICSDGEQYALLSVMPTQHPFSRNDKTMDFSLPSLFGLTCKVLTADRGEELLMSYLAAFRARTSAAPEAEPELTAKEADSGRKWPGSFAKYDRDSSLWRTHQCSLLGGLDVFSETWPAWGSMRNGECWERETVGAFIPETEFGLSLPTTVANEYSGTSKKRFVGSPHFRGAKMSEGLRTCETDPRYLNPSFAELVMGWPLGWTGPEPLETDKFQEWRQQHSIF